ncbi:MAG: flippase-like domain-containing protein [Byssovorax sp.]
MNRRTIVRGIQLIVGITLATFTWLLYASIRKDSVDGHPADFAAGFAHLHPLWLLVAAVLALQEGVFGGLRVYVLGRVLSDKLRVRTAIISEFVLMFCAGVTPLQAGAAPSQVAVLANGGMRLVDVATAELLTALCTATFFLASLVGIFILRANGQFVIADGEQLDWLLALSVGVVGTSFCALILCAAYPPLLKTFVRVLAVPLGFVYRGVLRVIYLSMRWRTWATTALEKRGAVRDRLLQSVDEFNHGFRIYLKRGKIAYLTAQLLTFGFFCSRFAVAYFILLGLGLPVTPKTFVTLGPPLVQVILVQVLLNFALYLSPTPGASGVAEAGSSAIMAPWVQPPFVIAYLVIWRVLAMFLCMFVGGIYVFRYLGTDVLEQRTREIEAEKAALKAA